MFAFLRTGVNKVYNVDKKVIGEGTFAKVRRATHRQTGEVVAVKTIYKDRIKDHKVRLRLPSCVLRYY